MRIISGRISADDDLAVEKLTKKLEGLESQQATMKAVNAYFRKHKTLDGCPELTPEQAEKLKADMAQSWHLDKSKPYPAYLLSNNNANIRLYRKAFRAGWRVPIRRGRRGAQDCFVRRPLPIPLSGG